MAQAPGHRLGQIIGETLEASVRPLLAEFAKRHELFLDTKGARPARSGKKVTWTDGLGNKHDLDFVLERGGTADTIGVPVAFIETAWRRYTKHSRNKAQEIQSAVVPLVGTYQDAHPFAGAVLAGVFTSGSIQQLESNGFDVVYIPYATVIRVFSTHGIDVAYDEASADDWLQRQIDIFESLDDPARVAAALRDGAQKEFKAFIESLTTTVTRRITWLRILPLHGTEMEFRDVDEALGFISSYEAAEPVGSFVRFEVTVRYSNGDNIAAQFAAADAAAEFVESFRGQVE